jgi:hypothetical protein
MFLEPPRQLGCLQASSGNFVSTCDPNSAGDDIKSAQLTFPNRVLEEPDRRSSTVPCRAGPSVGRGSSGYPAARCQRLVLNRSPRRTAHLRSESQSSSVRTHPPSCASVVKRLCCRCATPCLSCLWYAVRVSLLADFMAHARRESRLLCANRPASLGERSRAHRMRWCRDITRRVCNRRGDAQDFERSHARFPYGETGARLPSAFRGRKARLPATACDDDA